MFRDVNWSPTGTYKYNSSYKPTEFFTQGLLHAERLDLLLGYFSFSALNVLSTGFAKFIASGGEVRVVANNIFSSRDKEAINNAKNIDASFEAYDFSDVRALYDALDSYGRHFFDCMSWLLRNKRISFTIIRPNTNTGTSHYKDGLFFDGTDEVHFSGSANFTARGLVENAEKINVFKGYADQTSRAKVEEFKAEFESILDQTAGEYIYLDAKDIEEAILDVSGNKELKELLITEKELIEMKSKTQSDPRLSSVLKRANEILDQEILKPRFPFSSGPRDYQEKAFAQWLANDRKGVFSMATGTGKTITALNCILTDWRENDENLRAIIIVPTTALVLQWKEECEAFNFQNIVTVSGGSKWRADLEFIRLAKRLRNFPFIIITTYASFSSKRFKSYYLSLPKDTVFIADEAHNLGSKSALSALNHNHLVKRIGLSATIERQFDALGNGRLQEFFNDRPPYTYEYSMKQALENGILTKYLYFPKLVELDEDELEAYVTISRQLMKFIDPSTGSLKKSKEVEFLLLKRKRIIHKARRKQQALKSILEEIKQDGSGLKYGFIYVPEGKEADYSKEESISIDKESVALIDQYTRIVSSFDSNIRVGQFASRSSAREEKLELFSRGMIDVLTSMKCLDEGVDVPRAEIAIFCASTGNPRQFIQRRGRVLRKHPDKHLARIYDLVVIPRITGDKEFFNFEKSLISNELNRVRDFMSLSINSTYAFESLSDVLDYYNLTLSENAQKE